MLDWVCGPSQWYLCCSHQLNHIGTCKYAKTKKALLISAWGRLKFYGRGVRPWSNMSWSLKMSMTDRQRQLALGVQCSRPRVLPDSHTGRESCTSRPLTADLQTMTKRAIGEREAWRFEHSSEDSVESEYVARCARGRLGKMQSSRAELPKRGLRLRIALLTESSSRTSGPTFFAKDVAKRGGTSFF